MAVSKKEMSEDAKVAAAGADVVSPDAVVAAMEIEPIAFVTVGLRPVASLDNAAEELLAMTAVDDGAFVRNPERTDGNEVGITVEAKEAETVGFTDAIVAGKLGDARAVEATPNEALDRAVVAGIDASAPAKLVGAVAPTDEIGEGGAMAVGESPEDGIVTVTYRVVWMVTTCTLGVPALARAEVLRRGPELMADETTGVGATDRVGVAGTARDVSGADELLAETSGSTVTCELATNRWRV